MLAWLEIPIGDISAWSSASLSFYAWYVTGSWSLADYLRVDNSSDGTNFWVQWTQTALSSSGWEFVSSSLSTSTTSVAFIFESDPTVGLGPYEGVYIDDIVVTVTDSQAPISSVGAIWGEYQSTSSFSVPYTASDLGGSGLAYVELYYRLGTSGAFTLYTTTANPFGHWTSSPIAFDSSQANGDGAYQFYTVAVDTIGNREVAPATPDATTIVDTEYPLTLHDISGTLGLAGWYTSSVTITLNSTDDTSGVSVTIYRIDDGDWYYYTGSLSMPQGIHTVFFYAIDNAGNTNLVQQLTVMVDSEAPETEPVLYGTMGSNGWYMGDSLNVWFTPVDYVSQIASTTYRIDNGTWQTFAGSFPIYKEGQTVIDYYSTDIAGNVESPESVSFKYDSSQPTIAITHPLSDSKISKDSVTIEWSGADYVSEIDHYEVRVDGGNWVPMGTATSYELRGLQDKWYGVTVKAVDKSGNNATTTVGFGIYTSIWSENGPYNAIPLYAVIVTIIAGVILSVLLYWRKRKGGPTVASVPKEEHAPGTL
jgi:hypothetical protein